MKRAAYRVVATVAIASVAVAAVEAQRSSGSQPGETELGPTTGREMIPPFNPQYYLGEWEIEWTPPDTPLIPGGMYTGTETVSHINSRYLRVDVAMEGEEGNRITGQGMLFYDWGLNGQSVVRYVAYDAGFSLLQYGPLGGDLGGYYSQFWEIPRFEFNDHAFALRGRSYYVSPAAYRINQQISVDDGEYLNFGTMWLTKEVVSPTGR